MGKRLSIADIYKEYPDQFIGITNIKYHGGVVLAAEVVCQGTSDEIFLKQMQTDGRIRLFSTKERRVGMSVGVIG